MITEPILGRGRNRIPGVTLSAGGPGLCGLLGLPPGTEPVLGRGRNRIPGVTLSAGGPGLCELLGLPPGSEAAITPELIKAVLSKRIKSAPDAASKSAGTTLLKQALTDEDRQRIADLYSSGSEGMPAGAARGALRGSMLGAAALGVPVGAGVFGLGHWLLKGLKVPSPYSKIGYGASATLAAILALRAAKHGIIPGAIASGAYGALRPSGAKKELYDIAKGYDPELQSRREKSLARKALKDIQDYQQNY